MVLGFPRFEDYMQFSRSHGAIVGRVANRTREARFELDGQSYHLTRNHGAYHIHGCLGSVIWEMDGDAAQEAVRLSYHSPDGEDGYPGDVDFAVTYRLEGPRLICEMEGRPDRRTPINLAHHAYFNAGGGGTVSDHVLLVQADEYTPLGPDQIPLGTIEPVEGTPLDFREGREIGDTAIDNNFVLRAEWDRAKPSASAVCPRTGIGVRVWTDEPGLQVFDAPTMTIGTPGHGGQHYGPFAGLCFEAQHYPDSLHHPDWPSVIRSPENPYFQRYVVEIGRESRALPQ
jgi:aldose 1-epimerase